MKEIVKKSEDRSYGLLSIFSKDILTKDGRKLSNKLIGRKILVFEKGNEENTNEAVVIGVNRNCAMISVRKLVTADERWNFDNDEIPIEEFKKHIEKYKNFENAVDKNREKTLANIKMKYDILKSLINKEVGICWEYIIEEEFKKSCLAICQKSEIYEDDIDYAYLHDYVEGIVVGVDSSNVIVCTYRCKIEEFEICMKKIDEGASEFFFISVPIAQIYKYRFLGEKRYRRF